MCAARYKIQSKYLDQVQTKITCHVYVCIQVCVHPSVSVCLCLCVCVSVCVAQNSVASYITHTLVAQETHTTNPHHQAGTVKTIEHI